MNMLISQTEGYFENPKYNFLEKYMLSLLALIKMKRLSKSVVLCYEKNQLKLYRKTGRKEQPFISWLFDDSACKSGIHHFVTPKQK